MWGCRLKFKSHILHILHFKFQHLYNDFSSTQFRYYFNWHWVNWFFLPKYIYYGLERVQPMSHLNSDKIIYYGFLIISYDSFLLFLKNRRSSQLNIFDKQPNFEHTISDTDNIFLFYEEKKNEFLWKWTCY